VWVLPYCGGSRLYTKPVIWMGWWSGSLNVSWWLSLGSPKSGCLTLGFTTKILPLSLNISIHWLFLITFDHSSYSKIYENLIFRDGGSSNAHVSSSQSHWMHVILASSFSPSCPLIADGGKEVEEEERRISRPVGGAWSRMERRRIGALDLWLRLLAWAFIPLVMLAWLQSKGILRFGAPRVTQPHACENFYELHVIIIFTIVL
jgi:hypothetical protein